MPPGVIEMPAFENDDTEWKMAHLLPPSDSTN
jgi:hypothetical protein